MKKTFRFLSMAIFIIAVFSVFTISTFAADDCDHSYGDVTMRGAKVSDATCTESAQYKAICTKCGQPSETVTHPFGAPLGHDYGEWITTSGEHTRYCERDGCSYSESEGCSYSDTSMRGAKVSDATCTESAQYKAICTKCGQPSETVTHPFGAPLGHDYGEWITTSGKHTRNCERDGCSYSESEGCSFGAWSITVQPTCTNTGVKARACTVCGVRETVYIGGLGHSYGSWQIVTSASCTSKGEQKRVCSECGETETKSIDALGHKYVNNVCSVCGDDNCDHSYGDVTMRGAKVSDATCTDSARYKAICTKCGRPSETVTHPFGDPLGHDYGEWITTSGKHTRNCERDGCSYSESEGCSYSDTSMRGAKVSDATCTESAQYKAICTKCGRPSETVTHPFGDPLGHDYGEWITTSGKHTRNCERDGCSYSESGFCSFGAWSITVQPTCTNNGVKARTCTVCGARETVSISALGHSYGSWQIVTSASCTSKGEQKRVCSECGETETKSIDALGHKYVNNVCSVCGDDKTDETTKAPDETIKTPDKTTSVLVKDHPIEKILGAGLGVALVLGVIVIAKKARN